MKPHRYAVVTWTALHRTVPLLLASSGQVWTALQSCLVIVGSFARPKNPTTSEIRLFPQQ
jgi:hypothetical protein